MKLQPLADRVVIRPLEKEQKTEAGIYIPDTASKERPQEGEVLAVGPGKMDDGKLQPMNVKVGDKVLFTKYGPTEVKVDGEELLIASESDILAVIG